MSRITKAYVARLSNDGYVKIDGDEIDKVVGGMQAGRAIVVRNGVINPSYIVGIMEDRDRIREWLNECEYGANDERGIQARTNGIRPLKNIFEGSAIEAKMIEAAKETGIVPKIDLSGLIRKM